MQLRQRHGHFSPAAGQCGGDGGGFARDQGNRYYSVLSPMEGHLGPGPAALGPGGMGRASYP